MNYKNKERGVDVFFDKIINVTKIYSVDRIVANESSEGKTVSYPSNLPTYELVFFVKVSSRGNST